MNKQYYNFKLSECGTHSVDENYYLDSYTMSDIMAMAYIKEEHTTDIKPKIIIDNLHELTDILDKLDHRSQLITYKIIDDHYIGIYKRTFPI